MGNLIILWLYNSINHNFTQCNNTNQIMGRFWNINLQLSYLHYCPQLYCNFRSSEATLNSTSGSLGRSSFEVTESIEASDTTLHTNSTNGGLLRSQVRFQKFISHFYIFWWMSFVCFSCSDHSRYLQTLVQIFLTQFLGFSNMIKSVCIYLNKRKLILKKCCTFERPHCFWACK